ncbi:porin family protein [bacterium]|nr:porin family protein [bacterium]
MKKGVLTAVVFIFLLAVPSQSFAQGGIYLGALGGISIQKPSLQEVEFNTDTTYLYGLRAGVKFMMFAVELNYFQAAHNLELQQMALLDWEGREVDYNFVGVNLKYFLPFFIFHPYLTGGYGYYTAHIHEIDKDTDGGFNFGLGLELNLGKRLSLLAEGKYHYVQLDINERDLKMGDFTVTGGISLYF